MVAVELAYPKGYMRPKITSDFFGASLIAMRYIRYAGDAIVQVPAFGSLAQLDRATAF